MNILLEYIKLIPLAFKHPQELLEGWMNDARMVNSDLKDDEVIEIMRRRDICHTCPFNSKNAKANGWYNTERLDEHCTMCSCPITKKTACLSCDCGISNHNDANPDKKLELKWLKYK